MDFIAASSSPPDHQGGDAATVTSSEVSRSSSEVAVTHDPFHPTTTTSSWHPLRRPNAIPKAITLTTTVTTPLLLLPTTDVLLYQQLQKRLRPEDIPSIPSLSLRNQRRRFHYYSCDDDDHDPQQQQQRMGTTTTTTTTPRSFRCHRPVCNFVNYLGHDTRMAAATAPPPRSDPDRFATSLISLWQHDGGNDDDGRRMMIDNNNNTGHNDPTTTTMPPPPQFASIVTVDDDDHHDMWGWSSSSSSSSSSSPHWEDGGGDWGLPLLLLPGRDIGTEDDDDVGLGSWDDPIVTTTTHQHLDDDHNVTALLDPFSLPYGPLDDATDLFDFD